MTGVLVVGSTFGALHARAVRDAEGMELIGLLGAGSTRTLQLAAGLGVPAWSDREDLPTPDQNQVASVVVRSTALGGHGVEIARALMERGWHVVIEQPVRADEIKALAAVAVREGVGFRVGNLYLNLPPVAAATRLAASLREITEIKAVNITTSTQTLFVGACLARRLCGPGAPVIETVSSHAGINHCVGRCAGVGLMLQVHNEHDPSDRDNGVLGLVRAEVTTAAGHLELTDAIGPLDWIPRLVMGALDSEGLPTGEHDSDARLARLVEVEEHDTAAWIRRGWTAAIARDIQACGDDGRSRGPDRKHLAEVTADATWWTTISRAIGLPVPTVGEWRPVPRTWFDEHL